MDRFDACVLNLKKVEELLKQLKIASTREEADKIGQNAKALLQTISFKLPYTFKEVREEVIRRQTELNQADANRLMGE